MPELTAAAELDRLGAEYFETVHTADPFNATQLGVAGFDGLVPDPSRDGSARVAGQLAGIERGLAAIDLPRHRARQWRGAARSARPAGRPVDLADA